ncbi:MAG: phosphoribosylformylglycinamidine synthase [Bacteroides sp.]|nr:phosphoribosylformylglycinamidine synthase [Bacteroides sp.]MCM1378702.1 phosphoribosylformylglycinamidine synthase [Bacteroides sp.]MCM1444975.1 phosphoribosylformylglycinamidine synthase [Prevotella sp.]
MIHFFRKDAVTVYAVDADHLLSQAEQEKFSWLFSGAKLVEETSLSGCYIGPRREMITPWSTNAVEITQNMGLAGVRRIEEFTLDNSTEPRHDKMLQRIYNGLDADIFKIDAQPAPIVYIDDIHSYNLSEGLALSPEEEKYLTELSEKLGRPLTDSEVFGFSQVNSEHCRHKIFNGTFVIDGKEKPSSLFKLIKKTSQEHPHKLVSAYKDNVAFVEGPQIDQFAPVNPSQPDYFEVKPIDTVLSLKAETHNFPTTVEPFNGAATGSGGEIRDRLGGGRASLPLAGTAVYMTSYPRHAEAMEPWEAMLNPRVWLYQTPAEILIKASNGASDFGNKFGQPLICGSLLTFEHDEDGRTLAYDKVIMLAGGVGFANKRDALKGHPTAGEKVIVMGGDNYRIGMGGGAVSSVATGQYDNSIELNAVQRANPEMQKRVANVIRALAESPDNPIVSIHDHGAGGHLNALSELVEETGGKIEIGALPVGDSTLSSKEIVGNESQERMGMVMDAQHIDEVKAIAERERAPFYVVGETTGDDRFVFEQPDGVKPIDLAMGDMFGSSPKTVMIDQTVNHVYANPEIDPSKLEEYIYNVLSLEAVGCKDWLTNKVDRSVTGKVARQQCQGVTQMPLSDCGAVALDFTGTKGIATSIGHAPQVALVDSAKGSVMSIAEALTNLVGAPLTDGLAGVSLSANWMWPCRNEGEDAALYNAVQTASDFACAIGVNIPTGKDSLSMTQKYGDKKVLAPGTVIISAAAETGDVRKIVGPVLQPIPSTLLHLDFSFCAASLGGSALYQTLGRIGTKAPTVASAEKFKKAFAAVQQLVKLGLVTAVHDISAGGTLTAIIEMMFAASSPIKISVDGGEDPITTLFAENPGVLMQIRKDDIEVVESILNSFGFDAKGIGLLSPSDKPSVHVMGAVDVHLDPEKLLKQWFKPSHMLDRLQSGVECADLRAENYGKQPVKYNFAPDFDGTLKSRSISYRHNKTGIKAAIIREKGVNGDREMAYSLYLAGFDVKDVHMTDLMTGRETLDDIDMIVFCGGFSNSDVLGSAKGWASGFKWNDTASEALKRFYNRKDTLSLGVCNGCQLMMELDLLGLKDGSKMEHNISHKFESTFLSVDIPANNSVMFSSLAGRSLGIWVAHGEGKFALTRQESDYHIAAKYSYSTYPGNPNGSKYDVAALCSADGRHLAIMPHLERAIFPWQCGYYPAERASDKVTPWIDAFINARKWIEKQS